MSMSTKTIIQDFLEVESHLNDADIEGARDLLSKLKDDTFEVLEAIDNFLSDIKKE